MNIPVPKNRLVALTLAGALLTTVIAGALAVPGFALAPPGDTASASTGTNASVQQLAADAPTPNQDFTPAVQTQSGYEDGEHKEEYEEGDEDEEYEEGDEDEEYEEGDEDEEAEHEEGEE
jgi:hypothetical protein